MTASCKWLLASVLAVLGCGHAPIHEVPDPLRNYNMEAIEDGDVPDFRNIYQQMGVVSSPPPISFLAGTASFATASPDTTLVVLSLSFPNRGLTFQHDGPMFRAEYQVEITLQQNGVETQRVVATDTVRVATLKETNRTDESIIFRQAIRVRPGPYVVSYRVRDNFGNRDAAATGGTNVPRFAATSLSFPVVVYEATPRKMLADIPQYLPTPRAAVTFGVDATIPVYLEAYGTKITTPFSVVLRNQKGAVVARDTAWLAQRSGLATGVINVPLDRADIGVFTISVSQIEGRERDTATATVFIGFGPDLPVISFKEMVRYLRFFTTYDKIRTLEEATGAVRGAAWSAFVRSTDPSPESSQNEALQDYFRRIRDANVLFRFDGLEGWLTDRGSVYVALGMPDLVQEREGYWASYSQSLSTRVRFLIWEYRDLQSSIIFYDEIGSGQWKMVPSSASNFRLLLARRIRQQ